MKDGHKKKIMWKPEEDILLKTYVEVHGEGHWSAVSKKLGLRRGGKSCRLRWKNYLRPDIKRGSMSEDEEDLIIRMHKLIGNSKKMQKSRAKRKPNSSTQNSTKVDVAGISTQEEANNTNTNKADDFIRKDSNHNADADAGGSKDHNDDDDKFWFSSDDLSGEIIVGPGSGAGNLSCGIMDMHLENYDDDQFMIFGDGQGFWDHENNVLFDTFGCNLGGSLN
ncbi:hypothetical protein V2J09_018745 [Rumex salicifolius]